MTRTTRALRRATALLVAGLLFAPAARAGDAAAGAAEEVFARVTAAYGGRAALDRVRAYRMEGTITSSMRGGGPLVRTFARPDRLRVDLDYPGHPERRILDGAKGWRSDGKGNMLAAEGPLLSSMVLQAARADLPWLLLEKRAVAKALPPMDGGKLAGFEIPLGGGLTLTVYVESASGRIARSAGVLVSPGMNTNFANEYKEFKVVDGVLFPFRELNYAGGQSTGETVVTKITVNPPLPENEFRP
jgi:hypothetical protein